MAATAAYVNISRVPKGDTQRSGDGFGMSNANASSANFALKGGTYTIDVIASTFGTVTLQRLGPDGSTFLTAQTAFAANGTATVDLPGGTYKIALA